MGEFELIARIRERLGELGVDTGAALVLGSGDDAAVTVPRGAAATSVDAFVEGVHFRRRPAGLAAVGRKALGAALSDLAAMGAAPGEAYVVLGVPDDLEEDDCLELLEGLAGGAAEWGVALAGGDVTRSPALMLALTVVGYAEAPERLVRRGGARAEDRVVLTGELGGAAAGLLVLERGELASAVPAEVAAALRARQLEPAPRLEAGAALAEAGASAMIDVSDGLGGDAAHLAEASAVGLAIELARVPVAAGVREIAAAAGVDWLDLVAGGGEDYELLACLPAERLEDAGAALAALGCPLAVLGRAFEGSGVDLRDPSGAARAAVGFDQLRRGTGEPA